VKITSFSLPRSLYIPELYCHMPSCRSLALYMCLHIHDIVAIGQAHLTSVVVTVATELGKYMLHHASVYCNRAYEASRKVV
jgi:hypothetical protein